MKKLLLALACALLVCAPLAHAQPVGFGSCNQATVVSSATLTASTQLVAAPAAGAGSIRICAVTIQVVQGSSPANFGLTSGTGSACGTGTALVTPAFLGVASTAQMWEQAYNTAPIALPPAKALCLTLSAAPTGAVVMVSYAVF